jgi:hypothetical protein
MNLLATRLAFNAYGRAPIRPKTPLAPQFCVLRFPVVCSEQKIELGMSKLATAVFPAAGWLYKNPEGLVNPLDRKKLKKLRR